MVEKKHKVSSSHNKAKTSKVETFTSNRKSKTKVKSVANITSSKKTSANISNVNDKTAKKTKQNAIVANENDASIITPEQQNDGNAKKNTDARGNVNCVFENKSNTITLI